MTIISMLKRFLSHSSGIKKAMPTFTTFKTTNKVIPFLPVESGRTTFRASKPDRCIQLRHFLLLKKLVGIITCYTKQYDYGRIRVCGKSLLLVMLCGGVSFHLHYVLPFSCWEYMG